MLGLESLGAIVGDPELRRSFGQLAARKIKADLKTIEAHGALSRKLAEVRRRPGDDGQALKRIIREHLDYYRTLIDLSYSFHQRLIDLLGQLGQGAERGSTPNGLTLSVKAPRGATVRAPFKVTNNRNETITVTCRASPLVSEDGAQMVASRAAFLPPGADIAPGAEQVFEVILPVGADFVPGRTYLGTLAAEGLEAMEIILRLAVEEGAGAMARQHSSEAASRPDPAPPPGPAAAPPSRASKARSRRRSRPRKVAAE